MYIGNQPSQVAFLTDQFSGNGSTTAYIMSVAPANTSSVLVAISGVLQDPTVYSVVGTTLTFSSAPPTGTGNISVRYLGIPASGVATTAYRTETEFTATANQKTFTPPSYTVGYLDVYRNGVKLLSADYTASNGTTVVLTTGAAAGDSIEIVSFYVSAVTNAIPNTVGSVSSSNIQAGVTLTSPTVSGSLSFVDGTSQNTAARYGMRNRVINGAMVIDQRNAGASVTPTTGTYTVDRWRIYASQTSKLTAQQNAGSVTPPVGFVNYLGCTSSSAYSVLASDLFLLQQFVEGFNVADLQWGTANAKTVTLSFWVFSSLTGTFGGSFQNSAGDRCYPFSYSISVANTWTAISITVAGDTIGTWLTTNGKGIVLSFGLGAGSTASGTAGSWQAANYYSTTGATSVVGTSGATFYITGVQLESGSVRNEFDYRPYGTELALCQRYYYRMTQSALFQMFGSGFVESSTSASILTFFPVTMRVSPSALEQSGTASHYTIRMGGASAQNCTSVPTYSSVSQYTAQTTFTVASGLTVGQSVMARNDSTSGYLAWSAEL